MRTKNAGNLAIIGASGTGKTTLAVGLYATSTEDVTFSPVGDETRKYLDIRKSDMQNGQWPAATLQEDNFDLRLRLHSGGRETDIVFREYMGERMGQPNYIETVIDTPKAAMILLNPGMPGLRNAKSRNEMIGNIKVIAQHLKDHKCSAVAFVVTASDRLSSDLAGFRAEFETYAAEVTNHLGTLGIKWKRFDVTVSGVLAAQDHPKLALDESNTAREPFLWLLERIQRRKRLESIAAATAWVAGAGIALCVAIAAFEGYNSRRLNNAEHQIEECIAALEKAHEEKDEASVNTNLKNLRSLKVDGIAPLWKTNQLRQQDMLKRWSEDCALWDVRYLALRLANFSNNIAKQPDSWGDNFEADVNRAEAAAKTFAKVLPEAIQLRESWTNERRGLELSWLKSNIKSQKEVLEGATGESLPSKLGNNKDFLERLRQHRYTNDLLIANLGAARTNALKRYCQFKADSWSPTNAVPPPTEQGLEDDLRSKLAKHVTDAEFDWATEQLKELSTQARRDWEIHHLPKAKTQHVNALNAAGAQPRDALRESLRFLEEMTNSFRMVDPRTMDATRRAIETARTNAISNYENKVENSWDIKGKRVLGFNCKEVLETVLTEDVATARERETFQKEMDRRFAEAQKQWRAERQKAVDQELEKFPKTVEVQSEIPGLLNQYMEFRADNTENPCLEALDTKMRRAAEDWIDQIMAEYNREFRDVNTVWQVEDNRAIRMRTAQKRFNDLKQFCLAMPNPLLDDTPLKQSWVAAFAKECVDVGGLKDSVIYGTAGINTAFEQTFRMTNIVVRIDFADGSNAKEIMLGASASSQKWDGETIVTMSNLFLPKASVHIKRKEGGKYWVLWKGTQDLHFNPWSDACLTLFWEEEVRLLNPEGHKTYKIWLEKQPDFGKKRCMEYEGFIGEAKNHKIAITVHGTLSGSSLNDIYRKHKPQGFQ